MRTISWLSHPQGDTCMTESITRPCGAKLNLLQFIAIIHSDIISSQQKQLSYWLYCPRLKGREQGDVLDF